MTALAVGHVRALPALLDERPAVTETASPATA